jgi:hypothetical protein
MVSDGWVGWHDDGEAIVGDGTGIGVTERKRCNGVEGVVSLDQCFTYVGNEKK